LAVHRQHPAAPSSAAARWPARGLLFALFTASGFAGLIYESIWTHYLKLFLGHAAYAQTLVLAIFMGGMALGSWLSSRWSPRWRNLLAAYAVTEAAIGLLGLVFHEAFTAATGLPATGNIAQVATDFISRQSVQRANAEDTLNSEKSLQQILKNKLSAASGVNIDDEVAQLTVLQNAYSANARVLQASRDMFTTLFNAVQ